MFERRRRVTKPGAVSPWPFVGMSLLVPTLFLYVAVTMPWYALTFLLVVWVTCFVLSCRWWTPHPGRLTPMALGAIALWFVVVYGGGSYFDWDVAPRVDFSPPDSP